MHDFNNSIRSPAEHMNITDNVDRKSASGGENLQTPVRLPYEPPALKRDRLTLITRGGTTGAGDSGAPNSMQDTMATPDPNFNSPGFDRPD